MVDRTFGALMDRIMKRLTALERRLNKRIPPTPQQIPPGFMGPYAGGTIPDGWLLCDGAAYSPTAYPALYASIGTQYGSSGSNFRVPGPQGRTIVALDPTDTDFNTRGKTSGSKTHTLTVAQMPAHSHPGSAVGNRGVNGDYSNSNGTSLMARIRGGNTDTGRFSDTIPGSSHDHPLTIASQGSGAAHPNVQPSFALAYIIKT